MSIPMARGEYLKRGCSAYQVNGACMKPTKITIRQKYLCYINGDSRSRCEQTLISKLYL